MLLVLNMAEATGEQTGEVVLTLASIAGFYRGRWNMQLLQEHANNQALLQEGEGVTPGPVTVSQTCCPAYAAVPLAGMPAHTCFSNSHAPNPPTPCAPACLQPRPSWSSCPQRCRRQAGSS